MDLKHLPSFDPEEIKRSLDSLGTNLKHSIDVWVSEKIEALRDAASCLSVLSEGLGTLLERSEHIFVKTITVNSQYPVPCRVQLRMDQWSWDLSDQPHSYEEPGKLDPGTYRVFLLIEKVGLR